MIRVGARAKREGADASPAASAPPPAEMIMYWPSD
jgi:hypothetical protein